MELFTKSDQLIWPYGKFPNVVLLEDELLRSLNSLGPGKCKRERWKFMLIEHGSSIITDNSDKKQYNY